MASLSKISEHSMSNAGDADAGQNNDEGIKQLQYAEMAIEQAFEIASESGGFVGDAYVVMADLVADADGWLNERKSENIDNKDTDVSPYFDIESGQHMISIANNIISSLERGTNVVNSIDRGTKELYDPTLATHRANILVAQGSWFTEPNNIPSAVQSLQRAIAIYTRLKSQATSDDDRSELESKITDANVQIQQLRSGQHHTNSSSIQYKRRKKP
jgi:hypothetical protein